MRISFASKSYKDCTFYTQKLTPVFPCLLTIQAGVTVIPQRSIHRSPQHYLLIFYTGAGRHSGTTSNVFCRIYGNLHKTKPIILRDPDRPMFQPSSVSSFLVTLSHSLDQIKEIHIWHDISGPEPPWYLEDVVICHLNTDVTWYFEAKRWLDVSTGSKEVECRLRPLQRKTYLAEMNLFNAKLNDNVKNKHLWFSPLLSNKSKTFSKFDKMSCCLAVAGLMTLIATGLVETTQSMFSDTSVRLGPWKLRLDDIYRATICSGISFIFRLLLESIFINSKRSRRTLDANERNYNVYEHVQDYFQKLNAIAFVEDNVEMDENNCALNVQNDNKSSDHSAHVMEKSEETSIENEDADQLSVNVSDDVSDATVNNANGYVTGLKSVESRHGTDDTVNDGYGHAACVASIMKEVNVSDDISADTINNSRGCLTDLRSMERDNMCHSVSDDTNTISIGCVTYPDLTSLEDKENHHSPRKSQDIGDLLDILGDLPEKEELIQILDNGSNDVEGKDFGLEDRGNNNIVICLDEGDLNVEFRRAEEEIHTTAGGNKNDKTIKYCPKSISWTSTVTNPDKIPQLYQQLPFPHHLIDKDSIKKLQRGTPKLPNIVLRITQAQCYILPFICTVVTTVIGVHWSVSIATSWIMTFALSFICQVFVLEALYMFLHAVYFAKWCQRPIREEDLINELSNKVWVNEDQQLTYYADEVVDEEEGELVPRPPTQEDIQKAQKMAGRDRELEDVLKMLAFDVLFLILLMLISSGNRDSSSYPIRVGMENSFNITKSFYPVISAIIYRKHRY